MLRGTRITPFKARLGTTRPRQAAKRLKSELGIKIPGIIDKKITFDLHEICNSFNLRNLVYYIPFLPKPKITVDMIFLSTLQPNTSDDALAASVRTDLREYYTSQYSRSIITWSPHLWPGQTIRTLAHLGIVYYLNIDPFIVAFGALFGIFAYAMYLSMMLDDCTPHKIYLCLIQDMNRIKVPLKYH